MALAPKGHPMRPLQLAVRSSRLLGLIFILIFILVAGLSGLVGRAAAGSVPVWAMMIVGGVYLVPGVLYFIFAIFLNQKKYWAAVGLIVVAGLHGILALIYTAAWVIGANPGAGAIGLLWVAALGQLIHHLIGAMKAIQQDPEMRRGFEPLMVQPPQQSP